MAKVKRTEERERLAAAIERRNDAAVTYSKHKAAFARAKELASESAAAVAAAEAEVEELKAAAHQQVVAGLYEGDLAIDDASLNAARRRLSDARDRHVFYAEAAAAVEERMTDAEPQLRRCEAAVDGAARAVVFLCGDEALERMIESERAAIRARALVVAVSMFSRSTTVPQSDVKLHRIGGSTFWGPWPGTNNESDTVRAAAAVKDVWASAFETLKRDADADLPA